MVPLALTPTERRLAAIAAVTACLAGLVAAAYVLDWCLAATDEALLGATIVGLALLTPTWISVAAGVRLATRVHEPWMDTRSLPRPTLAMILAAPLVIATTTYGQLGPADGRRWASLLPAVAAALALTALLSTLWRRLRRRDATRWTPLRVR